MAAKWLTRLDIAPRWGQSPLPVNRTGNGVQMPKFDMGAAWDDTVVLLKSHSALTGIIVAVFLFLPTLAFGWLGPDPIEPPADATFDQILMLMRESVQQAVGFQLLVSLLGMIGGMAVLRLWLSRAGTSVGEALVFAVKMLPTMIAIQFLLGLCAALIAVLSLMPALAAGSSAIGIFLAFVGVSFLIGLLAYLWGRLSIISPVVADQVVYNPFAAIQHSWRLTRHNGWRVFLFLLLVVVVILVAALIAYLIISVLPGADDGVGRFLKGVVDGGFTAAVGFVLLAVTAATYRQLAMRGGREVFA